MEELAYCGRGWLTVEEVGSLWRRLAHCGGGWFTVEEVGLARMARSGKSQ